MQRAIAILLGTLLAIGACGASSARADIKKVTTVEGITEYQLDNGLQLLLYPDSSRPTVTVNLTIMVGSRHEGYGETGMAHLLEHMVFKGTPTHQNIPKLLQERGARFNGTTWVDRTNYYETLPANEDNLKFALELESDRMVNSYVKREDLLSEMTVVRNEFERGENSPENLLDQRIMAVAFDWHNYGKSTIGNRSDIERVPIDRLKAFYTRYYQPDNAMLVIAGKFDEKQALELVDATFGKIPKPKRKLDKTYTDEPAQDGERTVTLRRVGDLALVGLAYHVPPGSHEDVPALEVLGNVLDAAPAGRLYKALVETKKATSVAAGASSWHDAGVFQVQAELRKEDPIEDVRDVLIEVTQGIAGAKITEEEVNRSKQQILKQRELQAADTSQLAIQLSNWGSQGDWRLYFLHRDRVEKVTVDDVERVAAKYLVRNNRTVGVFLPTQESQLVPIPEGPDLSKLLAGYKGREDISEGEDFDADPLAIEKRVKRVKLPENINAALLPKKTRGESVHLRLTLRYGTAESLKGYEAAAATLPQLMLRGTKNLSRQEIQDLLDKNRAVLAASGDVGSATFSVQTKREYLPEVLELLGQILREPTLPADEYSILQREKLAQLEEGLTDPQSRAVVAVRRTVSPYPKNDVRYIPTVEEEIERYQKLSREQLQKLYGEFLGSGAGELAIVGDFDVDSAVNGLSKALDGWQSRQKYERIARKAFPDIKTEKQRILTPDKANATYVAGYVFPMKDSDAEYPEMSIANFILGGGSLSSRLGDRVRQKEGLSYGVGSFFGSDPYDARASLTIFAIYNPNVVEKVESVIREEFDLLVKSGVDEEELERAKRGYLQQQQVSRSNDASLVGTLSDTVYAQRTMKYYADQEKEIGSLTPKQVTGAIKKHLDSKRLAVVVAGDFDGVERKDATTPAAENTTGAASTGNAPAKR